MVFRRWRTAFQFYRATQLKNARSHREALDVLGRIDSTPEDMAKKTLLEADILHRMHDYESAVARYQDFLSQRAESIRSINDREYLRVYCHYYLAEAQRKSGAEGIVSVSSEDVMIASRKASFAARGEFPP